jgi:hypothetical protein
MYSISIRLIWPPATFCFRTIPMKCVRKPKKDLATAARAYNIEGWERMEKGTISKDIGEGRWRDHGQAACYDYCEEDVRIAMLLLRKQLHEHRHLRSANVELVLHWSNYSAKAVALIQARGMPIDVPLWNLVQENKVAVIGKLLEKYDPSYASCDEEDRIYTPEGKWNDKRFERWLVKGGAT